jgi:hypothetical protein
MVTNKTNTNSSFGTIIEAISIGKRTTAVTIRAIDGGIFARSASGFFLFG